ncbi:uncharacterized protein FTJAE_1478 [Fusarium tjaetaba]|uniref:Uncharacterized protein n=1 Tax=Fusarium tjaetaba TaxID=1567544 RepID=A0A8H5W750_9HYPO|nr:uncharacterized protein FTJAE_1478 [Fusarium tjaetaba]KAF5647795.1 hypothetical protein FTJAE_1478 [Fusarium tjaetaba]
MGFFDNIWDGVKSAGQWAIDHAADITPVIGAVGEAAASFSLLQDSNPSFAANASPGSQPNDTRSQQLAKYHQKFAYVSNRLAANAKAGVKPPSKTTGRTTTLDDVLVGLWTDPKGLSSDGNPSVSMYKDLSAFMGTMNIPFSWQDNSGLVHDTVNEIGQVLFAKTGPQDLAELAKSGDPFGKVNTEVLTQDGLVQACHVYYPIPMGKDGKHYSLHSAIHLSYTTNA